MVRLEGWETRLNAVIEAARGESYALGERDCFRLACRVIEALTGVDRWSEFAGSYRTKRQALLAIHRHGGSFEEAGDWFFGCAHVPVLFARRGDIVAFPDPDGEKHLGVCVGAEIAVMAPWGLIFVELSRCTCAWRVG